MTAPFFSVIIPAYREGPLIRLAVESLLAQSEQDFELLVVDDGADASTKQALASLSHPKLRVIEQSNDGLSSARNRGLRHARGHYICFLDGDDSRPPWAFKVVRDQLGNSEIDVAFGGATVLTRDHITHPFYDERVMNRLLEISPSGKFSVELGNLDYGAKFLGFLEPSSSTKFIRREFARRISLTYPNGMFFEDIFTHTQLTANLQSFLVIPITQFTYHLAYDHAQITSGTTERRFDAISSSFSALDLMTQSARYDDTEYRFGTFHGIARLLSWCETEVNHIHRYQYSRALQYAFARLPKNVLPLDQGGLHVPSLFSGLVEHGAINFLRRHLQA